jgi:hypothetical protein
MINHKGWDRKLTVHQSYVFLQSYILYFLGRDREPFNLFFFSLNQKYQNTLQLSEYRYTLRKFL